MVIVLTLIFCLAGDHECKAFTPDLPGLSLQECYLAAQLMAADWINENGDQWHLTNWTCGAASKDI